MDHLSDVLQRHQIEIELTRRNVVHCQLVTVDAIRGIIVSEGVSRMVTTVLQCYDTVAAVIQQ